MSFTTMNHQHSAPLKGPLREAQHAVREPLSASVSGLSATQTADQGHGGATPLASLSGNERASVGQRRMRLPLDPAARQQALTKARVSREQQRQHWASLELRQDWADEAWMLEHLKAAGVRVGSRQEPATVARMRAKLRGVGVLSGQIMEAVGMPLGRFLQKNPGLPLWAALALVLEALGTYTAAVLALRD